MSLECATMMIPRESLECGDFALQMSKRIEGIEVIEEFQ